MKTSEHQRLAKRLGYAGLLPFVIALMMHVSHIQLLGQPETLFVSYSVVIASFLSGTLWRSADENNATQVKLTLYVSNGMALGAWTGWLLLPWNRHVALLLLVLVYIGIRWFEQTYLSTQLAPEYQQLRQHLTFIVVTCHLLLWAL
jgi:hypothetical protein